MMNIWRRFGRRLLMRRRRRRLLRRRNGREILRNLGSLFKLRKFRNGIKRNEILSRKSKPSNEVSTPHLRHPRNLPLLSYGIVLTSRTTRWEYTHYRR